VSSGRRDLLFILKSTDRIERLFKGSRRAVSQGPPKVAITPCTVRAPDVKSARKTNTKGSPLTFITRALCGVGLHWRHGPRKRFEYIFASASRRNEKCTAADCFLLWPGALNFWLSVVLLYTHRAHNHFHDHLHNS
jgi:hypothetical protein